MAVTKLDNAEKEEIIRLYQEGTASTAQLAQQFGVSVSTISRLIRESQPDGTNLRRSRRRTIEQLNLSNILKAEQSQEIIPDHDQDPEKDDIYDRAEDFFLHNSKAEQSQEIILDHDQDPNPDIAEDTFVNDLQIEQLTRIANDRSRYPQKKGIYGASGNLFLDQKTINSYDELEDFPLAKVTDLDDLDDPIDEENANLPLIGDEFDDDPDLLDDDEDPSDEEGEPNDLSVAPATTLTILPFSAIGLPEMCYLVVDKASEIVTRPLQDFRELGQITSGQGHARTMPVFSNHRAARRFCTPHQRIIKMPGHLMQAARHKLPPKGIVYVLLNGKVYMLL